MCQKSSVVDNEYTKDPKDIDFDELEKLLRENAKYISIVRLTGGEPLHFEKIEKLIRLLNELKLKYALLTNGSLLTPEISKLLMKNCIEISFSIDSADNKIYSDMRKSGILDVVSKNINYLNQLKEKNKSKTPILNIAATTFSFNISGLPDLIKYCQLHGIPSVSVSEGAYYNTPGIRQEHLIKNYPKEIESSIEKTKRIAKESGVTLRLNSPILDPPDNVDTPDSTQQAVKCINFYFYAIVHSSLDVFSCGLSYSIGNLEGKSLKDTWNGEEYGYVKARKTIKTKELPDSCRFCKDVSTRKLEDGQVYSYTMLQEERFG